MVDTLPLSVTKTLAASVDQRHTVLAAAPRRRSGAGRAAGLRDEAEPVTAAMFDVVPKCDEGASLTSETQGS